MDRVIIRVSGNEAAKFLQGLVTADLRKLEGAGILYAAMLTPQGKYQADFFLVPDGADILVDVAAPLAGDLLKRMTLYKLRAAVTLESTDMPVSRGTGPAPDGALPDPRHPELGWRLYGAALPDDGTDWDALRVAHCIPESGVELIPGEALILEYGLDRLGGVDFRKGCYVGQEVTARMQHKTELRKGLTTVAIAGSAPAGTPILAGERDAGVLYTQSGGQALAYLRFNRAQGDLSAGNATLTWPVPGQAA